MMTGFEDQPVFEKVKCCCGIHKGSGCQLCKGSHCPDCVNHGCQEK